eukprot:GHVU01190285.1.p1 GENE.GHVU01190285.1~~GHVU01190285.1.p1  ORF type:complete len:100 (+),score=4.79 GHVU01190285.1:479-778(+)
MVSEEDGVRKQEVSESMPCCILVDYVNMMDSMSDVKNASSSLWPRFSGIERMSKRRLCSTYRRLGTSKKDASFFPCLTFESKRASWCRSRSNSPYGFRF